MMDTISTFLKENYDLITLFVGLLGVIIAFIALAYEMKKKSQKRNDHIK